MAPAPPDGGAAELACGVARRRRRPRPAVAAAGARLRRLGAGHEQHGVERREVDARTDGDQAVQARSPRSTFSMRPMT